MTETRSAIMLRDLKLDTLVEQLPNEVFVIDVGVTMARSQARDTFVMDHDGRAVQPPSYPIPLKSSGTMPYVGDKRVYIRNPVEGPRGGQESYLFEEFVKQLQTIKDLAEELDRSAAQRMYVSDLRLCEVPSEYARSGTGWDAGITSEGVEENVPVTIGQFEKQQKVSDAVQEQLGESTPGRVIIPMTLTDATIVHMKPTKHGDCRRFYFREKQAKKNGSPDLAPQQPRTLTWTFVDDQFPELVESELIANVEFDGHTENTERFIEEDARIVESGGGQ
jgi:hypothetical protein